MKKNYAYIDNSNQEFEDNNFDWENKNYLLYEDTDKYLLKRTNIKVDNSDKMENFCVLGIGDCGSNSTSTVNQNSNVNVINSNTLNQINQNINNFLTKTIVNNASKCSANISQIQEIDLGPIVASGKGTVVDIGGIDQTQNAAVSFDCVNADTLKNDMANGVLSEYIGALSNNFSANSLNNMDATAKSKTENQSLSFGSANANSNVNSNYVFNSSNIISNNIQNVLQNTISHDFDINTVKSCIAQVKQQQKTSSGGVNASDGAQVSIGGIRQGQGASILSKCLQTNSNITNLTNDIVQNLGLKVDNTANTSSENKMVGTAESESKNKGLLEGFAGLIDSIGNVLTGILGNLTKPFIILSVLCCLCIMFISCGSSLMAVFKNSSNSSQSLNLSKLD